MHPLYEKANKLTEEVIAAAIEVHKHFGDDHFGRHGISRVILKGADDGSIPF